MAEYIEREAFIDAVKDIPMWGSVAVMFADSIPTADVAPVVHGRWVSLTDCANAGVHCSVCHKTVWREDYSMCSRKNKVRSNFCPHCGAKMDEKEAVYD